MAPKCRLHSDCIRPDTQDKGRTLSLTKGDSAACVHCHGRFCCKDCLTGHLTGFHPHTLKNVTTHRVCKHLPSINEDALEEVQPSLDVEPIPDFGTPGLVELHTKRAIESTIRQDKRWGVVIMDMFSGCGRHGRYTARSLKQVLSLKAFAKQDGEGRRKGPLMQRRPPVVLVTIDKLRSTEGTSLVIDARGLNKENISLLRGKFPNMMVVLLASPPCTEYSMAKTVGVRDLEGADALVRVVRACHIGLAPVCTVMENPAHPSLLPSRGVSTFLPNTCVLNYCAHGGMFFKKTQVWSGPKRFSLQEQGFCAKLCGGQEVCPIMLLDGGSGTWQHPEWMGTSLEERQSIPPQLSRSIGGAIGNYINSGVWEKHQRARK